jgi:hypothetical protein
MSKIIICIVILCGIGWAVSEESFTTENAEINFFSALSANSALNIKSENFEMLERYGIETNINLIESPSIPANPRPQVNWTSGVLMIPDWTTDSVGLFDPYDGTFLRFFCKSPTSVSPKNAIQGSDNNIYLADQVEDAVTMWDTLGTYLGVYVSASDGLDNVRGIAFRDGHLFVCNSPSSNKSVKEFSGPHTFVRDFITYTGVDPFDIHFLPDGRCLFADIWTADKIALHDTNGQFIYQLFGGNFPQQIQDDPIPPGAFLNAMWGRDSIFDFELDGTIVQKCTLKYVKGVYRMGNGNILATSNYGLWDINTTTGEVIRLNAGTGWQYIELYAISGVGTSEIDIDKYLFNSSVKIHPNPFKNRTMIEYNLLKPTAVSVKIYNCLGREVRTLVNQHQTPGVYSIIWDGKDNNGLKVPDGVYICNIRNADEMHSSKLMFIK